MTEDKPRIGISQCFTNSIVRYDAKSQFNKNLIEDLSRFFELIPICPEVESGLDVPRSPVELVETNKELRVKGRDDKSLDISSLLKSYSKTKVLSLSHISGYVFKARSPSCGVGSTPIYNLNGVVKRYSNGIFVDVLLDHYPSMPVIDDAKIIDSKTLDKFIDSVKKYALGIKR